jgi:hypothetical protein
VWEITGVVLPLAIKGEELMKRVMLFAVFALAIVAAPVQAKPTKPTKPNKCLQTDVVSYVVSGTLVSGGPLTAGSGGTYTGNLTVAVTKTNDHSKGDKGTTKSYTLTSVKVKLHGENPAALTAGSRVSLEGTITTLAKKCSQTGFTPVITIGKADITSPKPKH